MQNEGLDFSGYALSICAAAAMLGAADRSRRSARRVRCCGKALMARVLRTAERVWHKA